jgi:hypothetical protein
MHLELMRDSAVDFPSIAEPESVRTYGFGHCRYRTLAPLIQFRFLLAVDIATYPDETLDHISNLDELRYLRIIHMPKVADLDPPEHLARLGTVSLNTLPSWDASSKRTVVRSIAPLTKLPALEHVELLGVVPADRSLAPLQEIRGVKTGRFHGIPKKEVERFFRMSGVSNDFAPKPGF